MAYLIKEIFYTLQGEGANTGRPAVFCRFAGCNLWSGREKDRGSGLGGCSLWCDTDFVGINGPGGGRFDDAESLARSIRSQWAGLPHQNSRPLVVCTGGEPLLQLDSVLVETLHHEGFEIAIETNGTCLPPSGIDWICVSPKSRTHCIVQSGHELKLIFPQPGLDPNQFEHLQFTHFYLQPMDGSNRAVNTQLAVQYCLEHPQWKLSLQTHKFLGIP